MSASDETTRMAAPPGTIGPGGSPISSDSGWLTSSASIDHGRFGPGTILDNRYRVLGLLGRGGMGEVYKADDLRLGQQVALKFLPPALSRDPHRLAQFHNEVRTARQVSHPNVCRVYDIGEIDAQLFITMEYVDGEDLSVLLRRIGRLPEDKGLEIARQICAGLAAAHERGVLHRDLKPANIMLDGAGRVRIMDFSLAAVGGVTDVRAGTPAYMAPEQLAGQEVTVRSDIYALGLVLYELFTGRRAFEAKTLQELIEQHTSGTLTAPSTIVRSLDSAIDAAIVRCLDASPSRRPASAISVSAALPGGDPLAAALAAGETPSPEMVAAAGGDEAMLTIPIAITWTALAVGLVLASCVLASRYSLLSRVPLTKPPEVLADRAEAIRQSFGYTDTPADHSGGFSYDSDYLSWAEQHDSPKHGWSELPTGRPPAVRYWYRTGPSPLIPLNPLSPVTPTDPPLLVNGMSKMTVDTSGRLLRFEAASPQVEAVSTAATPPVNWRTAFDAAGLDMAAFTETAPSRTPAAFADERRAWKGTLPGTSIGITIEAAGYRGRPVLFDVVTPWVKPSREPQPQTSAGNNWIFVWALLGAAAFTAWVNVGRGRADLRGAFRIAAFMTLLVAAMWALGPHVSQGLDEQQRFFARIGIALFVGGAMYLIYLGLEPFVRRQWPGMLVGWSRVLSGKLRDPLVGRDVLLAVACGGLLGVIDLLSFVVPPLLKQPSPQPRVTDVGVLMGGRSSVLALLQLVNTGFQNGLITVFEYSMLRALFERVTRTSFGASAWTIAGALRLSDRASEKVFVAVCLLFTAFMSWGGGALTTPHGLSIALDALSTLLILVVMLRLGIFATVVMFFTYNVVARSPITFDPASLYVGSTWLALATLAALIAFGFRLATRQSGAWGRPRVSPV